MNPFNFEQRFAQLNEHINHLTQRIEQLEKNNEELVCTVSLLQHQNHTLNAQCNKFNAFLDNHTVYVKQKTDNPTDMPVRFNKSYVVISPQYADLDILRTLHAMEIQIIYKCNQLTRDKMIERFNEDPIFFGVINNNEIPLYMITLLFNAKFITKNKQDVTDLFEATFYKFKAHYDSKANQDINLERIDGFVNKRISKYCNVEWMNEHYGISKKLI